MKKTTTLVQILILLFSVYLNIYSQDLNKEYIISPRIGSDIDKNEKAYFNLFPKINNFKSAKSYIDPKDSIIFVIKYDSLGIEKNQNLGFSKISANNLKIAIENYERIFDEEDSIKSKINFSLLPHNLIGVTMRYDKEKESTISFNNMNGNRINGRILYADSTFLVICPKDYIYNWESASIYVKAYGYDEIAEFLSPSKMTLNGNRNVYLSNLSILQEDEPFIFSKDKDIIAVSPEIYSLFMEKAEIINKSLAYKENKNGNDTLNIPINKLISNDYKKWTFNIGLSPNISFQQDNELTFHYSETYYTPHGEIISKSYDIDNPSINPTRTVIPEISVEYNILEKLSVGVSLYYYTYKETITKTQESFNEFMFTGFKTIGRSFSLYCSFTELSYNPYNLSFWGNCSFSYLAGISYGTVKNTYDCKIILDLNDNKPYILDETLLGLMLGAKFDYYIFEYFSLYGKLNAFVYIPHDKVYDELSENYKLSSSKINNSSLNIFFGLSLHF